MSGGDRAADDTYDVFLSYAHADRSQVGPLASFIASLGLKVWLDTADLGAGDSIIESISGAIERADAYIVFLSPHSTASDWVKHELNTALTLETTKGRPVVLPVLIETTDLPAQLISRLYIDATKSLDAVRKPLQRALGNIVGMERISSVEDATAGKSIWIASAQFTLFKDTVRQFGGLLTEHSAEAVLEEAKQLLTGLRRRANGVLLNFIPANEVDWNDPRFKFPNGEISERIEDIDGSFDGTMQHRSIVDVNIINPDEEPLAKLVSSQLEALGVLRVGYQFSLAPPDEDLPSRILTKLQRTYTILSWDPVSGAEIALPDDVRITVRATPEEIGLAIETRYPFQLERRAKEFSVREFVDWLRG